MENVRALKFIFGTVLMSTLLGVPLFTFAYKPDTTHKALTQESVQFFESYYGIDPFSSEEERAIIQGGADEDDPFYRPLFHFYDPVYNQGIKGNITSKRWAVDTNTQAQFDLAYIASAGSRVRSKFSSDSDYSWDRAVYEYVHGDKERALRTLGHILHLIQDASVPAHTRDDAHPPYFDEALNQASVYEEWTGRFNPSNIQIGNLLSPKRFNSLEEHFDTLASFSNSNFFSKDTIFSEKYKEPQINNIGRNNDSDYRYGKVNGKLIRLVRVKDRKNPFSEKGKLQEELVSLSSPKEVILGDYWNILSKEAVRHGAGVIALFFERVEEERKTNALGKEGRTLAERIQDRTTAGIFNTTREIYGSSVEYDDVNDLTGDLSGTTITQTIRERDAEAQETAGQQITTPEPQSEQVLEENQEESEDTDEQNENRLAQTQETTEPEEQTENIQENTDEEEGRQEQTEEPTQEGDTEESTSSGITPNPHIPGAPASPQQNETEGEGENEEQALENEQNTDTTPPPTPTIVKPATTTPFTTPEIQFSGSAATSSIVALTFQKDTNTYMATTSASSSGAWKKELPLGQGTTTVSVTAIDAAGNSSAATTTTVFVDSIGPEINLHSRTCQDHSIGAEKCLVATTTLAFSWEVDEDVTHYVVDKNGITATTTATNTTATTTNGSTFTFKVSAVDTYGNRSATSSIEVLVEKRPVVINEIAWMGTATSSADEWIELYNASDADIDISDWILRTGDGSPHIELTGSIKSGGYYLLERTDDSTVSDVPADHIFTGALNNSGEDVYLQHINDKGTTTVDRVSADSGWFAGVNHSHRTMERYSAAREGDDKKNWGNALSEFIQNGVDAAGNDINGTPGERNGISYKIVNSSTVQKDKTLSPGQVYLIGRSGLTIGKDATLTAPEGVVIKTVSPNEPQIRVRGTLETNGTKSEPVVFTSFVDDEYGGDLNNDGICEPENASSTAACPSVGDWKNIIIRPSGVFNAEHTHIRYAGNVNRSDIENAAVYIDAGEFNLSNGTVTHSEKHGITLRNAKGGIQNSQISNNGIEESAWGMYIRDGNVVVKNNTLEKNANGIRVNATNTPIRNNVVRENVGKAVVTTRKPPPLSGNSGEENGENAIRLSGFIITNATTTLEHNQLSYRIENQMQIRQSAALTFEDGVVIKAGSGARISAKPGATLIYKGESPADLTFTSIHDDTVGSTVDAATTTPQAGDWVGINISKGADISLEGFTLRYAGDDVGNSDRGGLRIKSQSTSTIAHAVIENNEQHGIYAVKANLIISDATIQNHQQKDLPAGKETGITLQRGEVSLSNTTFNNNQVDIKGNAGAVVYCDDCDGITTEPSNIISESDENSDEQEGEIEEDEEGEGNGTEDTQQEQYIRGNGVDVTRIVIADFETYSPKFELQDVTETDTGDYVATYTFTSINLVDKTWKDVELEKKQKFSKGNVGDRDPNTYISQQLQQNADAEHVRLKGTQKHERKAVDYEEN